MSVAIAVVAHPARAAMASDLFDAVAGNVLALDVDGRGEQANHQAALEALLDVDADWLVLLEDDAVPAPRFRTQLAAALADAGDAVVSLYLGTGRWAGTIPAAHEPVVRRLVADADAVGARWITADALWHAVGFAVPRRAARELLAHLRADILPTDQAVTSWCQRTATPVRYTWPSLVDHLDGPTVTQHPDGQPRREARRAWRVAA
ncbi:hypothetical protein [Puerhibacterium puerhi]|uniref:hypothetical protein n=1 Tax=Puerhibacterium puerhi TaxID=2692623 RepID=UPI00135A2234|nr:hypothetical protein [Puerhibacterium puerhi]